MKAIDRSRQAFFIKLNRNKTPVQMKYLVDNIRSYNRTKKRFDLKNRFSKVVMNLQKTANDSYMKYTFYSTSADIESKADKKKIDYRKFVNVYCKIDTRKTYAVEKYRQYCLYRGKAHYIIGKEVTSFGLFYRLFNQDFKDFRVHSFFCTLLFSDIKINEYIKNYHKLK